ncbi:Signal transduction histidine kinase [Lutibacter agarilyticus]|uniref:histidine kinase n=1 Tax=Lutibacter agarilyticus TaxID=1109740 RepID=A0A238XQF9_9FLAO|nr:transporter substrate-binding domain-containing protein [Lutibacter agarilyticus]SNR61177.1 Signal transduction histidine kinase [Lutibacter agarilyticus]
MFHKIISLALVITFSICKLNAQYTIQFSDNYPPYNYLNENKELVGFNVDLLNAIIDLYKTDIQISSGNWKKINNALASDKIDAIGGFHFPGSLDSEYIYTRSAINTSHCFLFNSNYLTKFSLEYLRTSKKPLIAMWKNDVLIHYITSINPSAQFLFVTSYEDLVNAIDREDVTCVFGQRTGAMYYAKQLNKDYVIPFDHRILERSMGFKVSKNVPELASILNNGLEVILANGTYQQIYDEWIAKYDKSPTNWKEHIETILIISLIVITLFILLLIANWILQTKVRNKTKDLRAQLELNSEIMTELEQEKNKAQESDRMKSAFLANMSHEIRTPMNGILGFTNLLKTVDYSSEKQAQFIDIIQKSGHRMLDTINNIIDVSKLESGLEKPSIKEVNIQKNITELCEFFMHEASEKGLHLIFKEGSSTLSKPFYTDEYKLNSILTNLIKNGLKFTHEGYVELKYHLSNEAVEFWIKDTGIGIPLDKQKTIFDDFVQADYSHSSGYEGSGLGLSISKGYVELLNGALKLESETGKGSIFYVRIPNLNNGIELQKTPQKKEFIKSTPFYKLNMLIAEDDNMSFLYLKTSLEGVAKNIIRATNGKEVVELVKNNTDIDVILMDVKMPLLNGYEATKAIRKFNKTVYIIAQTAYAQENFKQEAIAVGCDSYISKPIDQDQLLKLLAKIIIN